LPPRGRGGETPRVSTPTFPFAEKLFENQVVLITGGGTGIGLSTARRFAALGAKVAIGSRKQQNIDTGLAALGEDGPSERYFGQVLDTREPEKVDAFVDAVLAKFGKIDVLINNAGGQFPSAAANLAPKGWDAVIRNNLNGTWYVTHAVANKAMLPARRGRIVNVIAQMWRGFPGMAHTGAARAGVDNLTKSLAVEWAPWNIRVNAVAPGFIRTSGTDQYPPEILEKALRASPMRRGGTPDEVAKIIIFLASFENDFVTGETWYVDGGQKLWGDVWEVPEAV
jgi:citronellol/citronellal dehydrogenase